MSCHVLSKWTNSFGELNILVWREICELDKRCDSEIKSGFGSGKGEYEELYRGQVFKHMAEI